MTKIISFSPFDVSIEEIKNVGEVLNLGWITTGPKTKEFERKVADYCNTKKAVCFNSATPYMELILRVLGIGPGGQSSMMISPDERSRLY